MADLFAAPDQSVPPAEPIDGPLADRLRPRALDDVRRPILFDYLIDDPAELPGPAQASDVLGVLPAVGSVLIPVVLGHDHELLPPHVGHPDEPSTALDDGDLSCGPG